MPYYEDRTTVRILVLCEDCTTLAQKIMLKERYDCKHVLTPHGGSFAFTEANVELVLDTFIPLVIDEDARGNDVEFVLVDKLSCSENPSCTETDWDFRSVVELHRVETRLRQWEVVQLLELLYEDDEVHAVLAEDGLFLLDDRLEEIKVPILEFGP